MRAFFFTLFLFASMGGICQVDIDRVVREVEKEGSLFFYPSLLERFRTADTSLTSEDYHYLYYGMASTGFNPYDLVTSENRLRLLNADKEFEKALTLADSILQVNPVNLVAFFQKSYALEMLNRQKESEATAILYFNILDAVRKSGGGLSPATAIIVLSPSDEFEVIRYYDLTADSFSEMVEDGQSYDILYLRKNKHKLDKIYFNKTYAARFKPVDEE